MIKLVVDPLWGPDDTATLQATSEPMMRFLAGKRPPEFDQLWRIVPRIMRCLPVDILDDRRLTYKAELVSINGDQVLNPDYLAACLLQSFASARNASFL